MGIIQSNIELYLPFESTLPSLGTDASGLGRDGVVYGVTQGVGKIGGAGVFDGTNDYIRSNTKASELGLTKDFTIAGWINPNNYVNVACAGGISPTTVLYFFYSNGQIRFNVYNSTTSHYVSVPTSLCPLNEWHYYTMTYNGSYIKVYIDSEFIAQTAHTGDLKFPTVVADDVIDFGRYPNRVYYFDGSLSKIKIFNTALSEQNIRREMIGLNAII